MHSLSGTLIATMSSASSRAAIPSSLWATSKACRTTQWSMRLISSRKYLYMLFSSFYKKATKPSLFCDGLQLYSVHEQFGIIECFSVKVNFKKNNLCTLIY